MQETCSSFCIPFPSPLLVETCAKYSCVLSMQETCARKKLHKKTCLTCKFFLYIYYENRTQGTLKTF